MDPETFGTLLPMVSSDVVSGIVQSHRISEAEAMDLWYNSDLYASLEDEQTKLWQYSTNMLLELLQQEITYGTIEYPEV